MVELVDSDGGVRFGIFSGPVTSIDERRFDLRDPFDRPRSRLRRYFSFKRFEFVGIVAEAVTLGCAVVDLRYLGSAFGYVFTPGDGRVRAFSFRSPLALGVSTRRTPERGASSFRAGRERVAITADPEARTRRLEISLASGLRVDAVLDEGAPRLQPLRVCTRAGATGWVYTRKAAGAPARGTVTLDGRDVDLAAAGAHGCSDFSAGFMRRETNWYWASVSGRLADGRRLGLNAACGVNETGFCENAVWVDGRLFELGPVHFEHDRALRGPVRMHTRDGRLELAFTPAGAHREALNAWIVASNFTQLFGRFDGEVVAGDERLRIDGLPGFCEKHYARW